jgi:DNA helicase-2/ATP-dependent DNA helicase PcrA
MCWADGLEGAARRIAETTESPLRVLAGPGTGKTFTLMRRVMRLIEEGSNPRRVLVCTFTRTAARDLQGELSRLGVPRADEVLAGTVHAFCFRLLSKAEVLRLTGRVPRPLLKFEERFLLADLQGTNGEGIRALGKRLNAFAAAWARLQSDTPGWPMTPQDRVFSSALDTWLRFHAAMLIGELVPEALRFLRDNPASPYRPRLDHVLVDEYQDLNRAEQVLLDSLAAVGTMTVIGDEDQSIYSFKYAHPAGIAEFDQGHPGTHDESLDECCRCPCLVVSMANTLIGRNASRITREIQACRSNPTGEVLVVQWLSMEDEANGIADFIQQRIRAGEVEPGRVLVLAPRRQLGYAIRDSLNARTVPAHSFFYEEALEGDPTKDDQCAAQETFTLLTLLARPDDSVALRCWCGFGSASLRTGAWSRLRTEAESTGTSPRELLKQIVIGTLKLSHMSQMVDRFRLLQRRLAVLAGLRGTELIDALFPASDAWAEPVRMVTSTFEEDGEPAMLLDVIQRGVTQPELPTDVDYVRVMSLHKSKGLTSDLVVVTGCVEGLIPTLPTNATAREWQDALEEQRRLFYVAITRTRNTLVLSSITRLPRATAHRMGALVVRGRGGSAPTIASRFLNELGPKRPAAIQGQDILRP